MGRRLQHVIKKVTACYYSIKFQGYVKCNTICYFVSTSLNDLPQRVLFLPSVKDSVPLAIALNAQMGVVETGFLLHRIHKIFKKISDSPLQNRKSCGNMTINNSNLILGFCRTGGMADTVDSKSTARKGVPVQVRGPVLKKNAPAMVGAFFFPGVASSLCVS